MRNIICGVVVAAVMAVVRVEVGIAAPPQLLNYQGQLTDVGGTPQNGVFPMTFQIFDAEVGGNALPGGTAWDETQNVEVVDGTFNVVLGSVVPLPVELFDGEPTDGAGPLRFLEVRIAGETLVPRRRITSAVYALRAGAGNIDLASSTAESGLITKDGVRFIHNFGGDNTFVGVGTGNFTMTGEFNTATGARALAANTTGAGNTATGLAALEANTEGFFNTATGVGALGVNTTGVGNTATGAFALQSNTTGESNTAAGLAALQVNTTGTQNTALGAEALQSNTTGDGNTALGISALRSNTQGDFNTATGINALAANTTGNESTATGADALRFNTTGTDNTATGANTLEANISGSSNTATGANALEANSSGGSNTATGARALAASTSGGSNTATGTGALQGNIGGSLNTATGRSALLANTFGVNNTATGASALQANITGDGNTAVGVGALASNSSGSGNTAIGIGAGNLLETGEDNIYVRNSGVAAESKTIRIGTNQLDTFIVGISGATSAGGVAVLVNGNGRLGTATSSRRFKQDVQDMGATSTALMRLRPVTFQYRREYDDGVGLRQYGLVAEEVAEVFPDLVRYTETGEPHTVRYHFVNAMLLNEVQKQHRKNERQQKEIVGLNARLAQLESRLGQEACQ